VQRIKVFQTVTLTIFLILSFLISSRAFGEERSGNIKLNLSGGFLSLEDSADSLFGRTGLGINLSSYLSLDLSLTNSFSKNGVILISIDSSLDLLPEKRLSPFAVLGAGAGIISSDGSTTTRALFNAGIGLRYSLYKDVFLTLDIRDYILGSSSRNWAASGGLVFYFDPVSTSATATSATNLDQRKDQAGSRQERPLIEVRTVERQVVKPEELSARPQQEETAKDTVAKQESAFTEGKVSVGQGVLTAEVKVEGKKAEKLSGEQEEKTTRLGTGVSRGKDVRMVAKKRIREKKVYEKAVLYGESSGQKQAGPEELSARPQQEETVKDKSTKQESTLSQEERKDKQEIPVPEEEKVTIKKNRAEVVIEFNMKETSISPENERVLKGFVMKVKDKKPKRIIIEGHACAHGPKALNLIISKKRALSVKKFLRDHGIKKNVTVRFYGEERLRFKEIPTPDNINDPHVRANRRVRIIAYW
jgi:outer membrane protein OmpA-like peptidoglycan-associated protein